MRLIGTVATTVIRAMVVAGIGMTLGGCSTSPEVQARKESWNARADAAMQAVTLGNSDAAADTLIGLWNEKAVREMPEGGIPPAAFNMTTFRTLQIPAGRVKLEPPLRAHEARLEALVLSATASEHETWVWHDLAMVLDDSASVVRVVEAASKDAKVMAQLRRPHERRRSIEMTMRQFGRVDLAEAMESTSGEALAEFLIGPGKPLVSVATSPAWWAY